MSGGVWSAAAGASAQLQALDITSNNLANSNTTAYRGEEVVFREYLTKGGPGGQNQAIHSASIASVKTRTNPGIILPTDRGLDVALHGNGLLVTSTPNGERFTRAGNLQVSPTGQLTTHTGALVLNTDKKPIVIPIGPGEPMIAADGTVTLGDAPLGKMLMVEFPDENTLEREPGGLLRATAKSGTPVPATQGLTPKALERPNVSVVGGMVDMVSISRSFDACQRAIDAFRDADTKAVSLMSPNG